MKRIGFFVLICFSLLFFLGGLQPYNAYGQEEKPMPFDMEGTEWAITHIYTSKGKEKQEPDTLIFKDGKFSSKYTEKKKYDPTNYTLSVKEDGATIWETMQAKEDIGTVFWRGEVRDGFLRGILSIHPKKGTVEDRNFAGNLSAGVLKLKEKPKPPEPEPAAETAELTTQAPTEIQPVVEGVQQSVQGGVAQEAAAEQQPQEEKSWWEKLTGK